MSRRKSKPHSRPARSNQIQKVAPDSVSSAPIFGQQTKESVHLAMWEGPLPPPKMLDDYSCVVQDGGERIMRLLESQQAHEQEWEKAQQKIMSDSISGQQKNETLGKWLGTGIATGAMILAGVISLNHLPSEIAIAALGLPALGSIGRIVSSYRGNAKDTKDD